MLKQLLAPQLVCIYVLAACAIYVHFRGRQRLRIGRQLGDHSTFLAPYNVLMYAEALRRRLHPGSSKEQRLGFLFVLQKRLEAVLPQMVR